MKNNTLKVLVVVIVLSAMFTVGFGAGKPTTFSSNEETMLTAALIKASGGDPSASDAMNATPKTFWMGLTRSEKMAFTVGFLSGFVQLASSMNIPIDDATTSVVDVVDIIDRIYTKRTDTENAQLAPMLQVAIWYKSK